MLTLIADSGSTKTDWVLINGKSVLSTLSTIGFNPYFQTREQISAELLKHLKPALDGYVPGISRIYYYGAGCSNEVNCKIIFDSIYQAFSIENIKIHHDLLAAARSLCGNESGIACILGTGSNSCLYDGNKLVENVPSVGYLFGDDGSGANIGKTFIQAYFDGLIPQKLQTVFESNGYHREEILDNVYKKGMPSKYLASVSKFVAGNIKDPYAKKLVKSCFKNFFSKQISKYTNSRDYKVHSVGSVGFHYKDILAEVANEEGYKLGKVIKSPLDGLIEYHQSLL
jgi:glucosamine kinase